MTDPSNFPQAKTSSDVSSTIATNTSINTSANDNVTPLTSSETVGPQMENTSEPPPSYVKLAMRNMVRKGSKSLFHFFLTTTGLIGLFIGLAYLTR